jgi:hypothetical protein
MRQGGLDLGVRGPAFEDFVRSEVSEYIGDSPILGESFVLKDGLTLKPTDGRREQLDLVFSIGKLLVIGEVKCSLQPTEAKQRSMHRRMVEGAAEQVQRKASAILDNREAFRGCLLRLGCHVPEDFDIFPMVVLNGAIHSGQDVLSVAVADINILRVFFEGKLIELAMQDSDGSMESLKELVLYQDQAQAASCAAEYFRSPPQLRLLREGVTPRWIPIVAVSDTDWEGRYFTLDCAPSLKEYAGVIDAASQKAP